MPVAKPKNLSWTPPADRLDAITKRLRDPDLAPIDRARLDAEAESLEMEIQWDSPLDSALEYFAAHPLAP